MSKTILVTGATGNIASLVIPDLIKNGMNVRAMLRDVSKGEALKEQGAEVVEGDFDDKQKLGNNLEGADSVLAITPPNPNATSQGSNILNAAKEAGVSFYLRISALGAAADAPTDNGRLHIQSDEELMNSGIAYTILRPHFFMQNMFASVDSIKNEGKFYMGMGEGKLGMIDVRDIADCCVSILTNGDHKNKIYTPTGPESIPFSKAAEIIGSTIGKEVNYVPVPLEAVRKAILDMGWGEWGAQIMVDYSNAYASGWGDFTTNDVEAITGKMARSFRQFVDDVFSPALVS